MNPALSYLPPTSISVNGPFRTWLVNQKEGLTGHIGEVFGDLSDASGWLGGQGESWERGPYYLDGLVALAYVLDDKKLKARVEKWVRAIRASQTANGNFGPKILLDWWPKLVVTKAFVTYFRATKNPAIIDFLRRFFDYMILELPTKPLYFWAYARGLEASEALQLVYEYTHDEKYRTLALTLRDASLDWDHYFADFVFAHKTTFYLNRTLFSLARPLMMKRDEKEKRHPKVKSAHEIESFNHSRVMDAYLKTHGVNIAMALKYPLYGHYWAKESLKTAELWADYRNLLEHHGNALGLFSSDEHLNGTSPKQGIELCVVVEAMYAMEEILRLSRDPIAADYLETYLYNALPATITPDYDAHQYCQQVNQTKVAVQRNPFYDADKTATTFGIAPSYGCCAANMHQGFPKALNAVVMHDEGSFYVFLYVAGKYDIPFKDGVVHVEIKTDYPFGDTVTLNVETTSSAPKKMYLRIPFGAKAMLTHQGKTIENNDGGRFFMMDSVWGDASFALRFEPEFKTLKNPDKTYSLKRGPLLFALPIASVETYIKGQPPFHDRGFMPKEKIPSPVLDLVDGQIKVLDYSIRKITDRFCTTPCEVFVEGRKKESDSVGPVRLVPYGQTILRIGHFKVRRKSVNGEK